MDVGNLLTTLVDIAVTTTVGVFDGLDDVYFTVGWLVDDGLVGLLEGAVVVIVLEDLLGPLLVGLLGEALVILLG